MGIRMPKKGRSLVASALLTGSSRPGPIPAPYQLRVY